MVPSLRVRIGPSEMVRDPGHVLVLKSTKNTQTCTSIFPASLAGDLADHVERMRARGVRDLAVSRRRPGHGRAPPVSALVAPGGGQSGLAHVERHPGALAPPRPAPRGRLLDAVRLQTGPAHVARLLGHANAAFTLPATSACEAAPMGRQRVDLELVRSGRLPEHAGSAVPPLPSTRRTTWFAAHDLCGIPAQRKTTALARWRRLPEVDAHGDPAPPPSRSEPDG